MRFWLNAIRCIEDPGLENLNSFEAAAQTDEAIAMIIADQAGRPVSEAPTPARAKPRGGLAGFLRAKSNA